MSWKRCLATGVLAVGTAFLSHAARAEDPAPPKKDAAPAAAKEAPKKKDPFFGDHFAMYLETRGGPATIETVKNPVNTTLQLTSENSVKLAGSKSGQFTVGWTLPRGRGQYLLTYGGIADGNYELDASGLQQSYKTGSSATPGQLSFLAPWWTVTVRDGQLRTVQAPPVWSPADDANGNTVPDPSELRYPTRTVDISAPVPKDLGNRIQTWDLVYRREFGGVRIRSRWTAGIRYLTAKGAIITPSWLKGVEDNADFGYSDGVISNFLLMQQSTKAFGPVGSGEVQFNFFRQRLTLYAMVQAAFLDEQLSSDSGPFTYYAHNPGSESLNQFPGAGRINRDVSKTSWNTMFEAGMRVKMLEGFHLILDWNRTGYLDSLLLPTTISIPKNASSVSLGTSALFISRDYVVTTINLGLSFQF